MVVLAAEVWTYWLAPPLLATALMMVILAAIGYYRQVALPSYLAEQQRQLDAMAQAHQLQAKRPARQSEQAVRHLPQSRSSDRVRLAA